MGKLRLVKMKLPARARRALRIALGVHVGIEKQRLAHPPAAMLADINERSPGDFTFSFETITSCRGRVIHTAEIRMIQQDGEWLCDRVSYYSYARHLESEKPSRVMQYIWEGTALAYLVVRFKVARGHFKDSIPGFRAHLHNLNKYTDRELAEHHPHLIDKIVDHDTHSLVSYRPPTDA